MEKIDIKNKKILYHLDLDSRQSFTQIGKKIGLHKDAVASRVKKLQEKGIIKYYYIKVNDSKLGYSYLRFYLTFQYVTPEVKNEIIDYFIKNKYVTTVHSTEGNYDLMIGIKVKNIAKFSFTWDKIFNKYRDFFATQVFSTICASTDYKHSFLLYDKENVQGNRILLKSYDDGTRIKIDNLDFKILKILIKNARIPTIEIADKLNSTPLTITNRIKKLIKSGIILGFRVNIDFPKIGYKWYKTDISLKDPSKLQQIIKFIEKNPNLSFIVKTIGYCDLELVFILKGINQLHQIIEQISKKFPGTIKNYTYFSVIHIHKWQWLPDE